MEHCQICNTQDNLKIYIAEVEKGDAVYRCKACWEEIAGQ